MTTNSSRLVVIAGGSGFLGRGLARCLLERGYETTILSRSASPPADVPAGVKWAHWDAESLGEWSACLDGAVAVVNFVGRSVDCRKTVENQRIIRIPRQVMPGAGPGNE
jgi:uncharacterized protein YbjT (DUF2867 family)